MAQPDWPALPYGEWAPTKKTLQMCTQMLGKARLALAPPQPEWLHTCLYLDSRGFTTGLIPYLGSGLSIDIDVYDVAMRVRASDGCAESFAIGPNRTVADIWADFSRSLETLGIEADIWEKPQEVADTTPFSENTHDRTIVPEQAQRFHRLLVTVQSTFDEFRSGFFGRTGVQFWWGAFDLAVLLFSGEPAEPRPGSNYIMRYDLDAGFMNAGFWPGDDSAPAPVFYAYIYPQPASCELAPVAPESAAWVERMGEWMLPYEWVTNCPDPRGAILAFLGSIYQAAGEYGGWDLDRFTYVKPAPVERG